jgi:ribosomal protein L7/L12
MDLITTAALVILLFATITITGNLRSTGRTVERVERKLDLVIKHLGIEGPAAEGIPPEMVAEIDRCIWSDRRVEAIKLYREATGQGLVEAKQWVDRRAASF